MLHIAEIILGINGTLTALMAFILGINGTLRSPQKTGHCLISCNVKAIKAIAMK
jgi:hypothetical protein